MRPKFGVPKMRLGTSKFALLNRLKTSQRISSSRLPPTFHVRASERSVVLKPGPITLLRGALPKVKGVCNVKADVSNQRAAVRWPDGRFGSRI